MNNNQILHTDPPNESPQIEDTRRLREDQHLRHLQHSSQTLNSQSVNEHVQVNQYAHLNALNNFSGIMQNFTLDSELHNQFRQSSAQMDTQEIESKYLGELNTKNTSIVHNTKDDKNSSLHLQDIAKADTMNLTYLNSNSKILNSKVSENDDGNQTRQLSQRYMHKNSSSIIDNSLSQSINTYTRCRTYEPYGMAANRIMQQFKSQPYNGLTTIASGGENECPNRSDNTNSYSDLHKQRSETFGFTQANIEQEDGTQSASVANRTQSMSQTAMGHRMPSHINQESIIRSCNLPTRVPTATNHYQTAQKQYVQAARSMPQSLQQTISDQNEHHNQEDPRQKAQMLIEEYTSPFNQSRLDNVHHVRSTNHGISQTSSNLHPQSNQKQTGNYSQNFVGFEHAPHRVNLQSQQQPNMQISTKENDQLLKQIQYNKEYIGGRVECSGSHIISKNQSSNNHNMSNRSAINVLPSFSESAFASNRVAPPPDQTAYLPHLPQSQVNAPQIITSGEVRQSYRVQTSRFEDGNLKGTRSLTTPTYRPRSFINEELKALTQSRSYSLNSKAQFQATNANRRVDFNNICRDRNEVKRVTYLTYDQRMQIQEQTETEKSDTHENDQNKSTSLYSHRKIINGNQVIRVNASDPTSIINSGRKDVTGSPLSGMKIDTQNTNPGETMLEDTTSPQQLDPQPRFNINLKSQFGEEQHLVSLLEKSNLSGVNYSTYNQNPHAKKNSIHNDINLLEKPKQANIYGSLASYMPTFNNQSLFSQHPIDFNNISTDNQVNTSQTMHFRTDKNYSLDSRQVHPDNRVNYHLPRSSEATGNFMHFNSSLANSSALRFPREQPGTVATSPMIFSQPQSFVHTQKMAVHDHRSQESGFKKEEIRHHIDQNFYSIENGSDFNRNHQNYANKTTLSFAPNTNTQLTKRDSVDRLEQQITNRYNAKQEHINEINQMSQLSQSLDQDIITHEQEVVHHQPNKPPLSKSYQAFMDSKKQISQTIRNQNPHARNLSECIQSQDGSRFSGSQQIEHKDNDQSFLSGTGQGYGQLGQTTSGAQMQIDKNSYLGASRSFSQDQFKTQTNTRLQQLGVIDEINSNTYSNTTSMFPPNKNGMLTSSTSKSPVLVEVLKQELLSCKRQLKDQQASNQFLKKEKFKLEHEQNLMQIQLNQGVEKMENVLQEYEAMKSQIEEERRQYQDETAYKDDYIERLEQQTQQLESQNAELNDDLIAVRDQLTSQTNEHLYQQRKSEAKKTKTNERVVSQLLQLHSAVSHLKDIVKLGKISDKEAQKSNDKKVVEYVEDNIETTVISALNLMGAKNNEIEEFEGSDEKNDTLNAETFFGNQKLQVRAHNFKKFRQSTQGLIQRLFDQQLKAKKLIIHDLETLIIKENSDFKQHIDNLRSQNHKLRDELQQHKTLAAEAVKEAEKLKQDTVPQMHLLQEKLREQGVELKHKYSQDYLKKEEALTTKMIKQKYQLQEEQERNQMLAKQVTELKIMNESLRMQLNNSSVHTEQWLATHMKNQKQKQDQDSVMSQSQEQALSIQKIKYKKLKEQTQKKDYFNEQEKNILKKQISEYQDTVEAQSQLIQELHRKIQYSQHNISCPSIPMQHHNPNNLTIQHSYQQFFPQNHHSYSHLHQPLMDNFQQSDQMYIEDESGHYQQLQNHSQHSMQDQQFQESSPEQFQRLVSFQNNMSSQSPHDTHCIPNDVLAQMMPASAQMMTKELEPIYEDYSKGEQSTNREHFQDPDLMHQNENSYSQSPEPEIEQPSPPIQYNRRQQMPVMTEIQQVYQKVNSTINNLMHCGFQMKNKPPKQIRQPAENIYEHISEHHIELDQDDQQETPLKQESEDPNQDEEEHTQDLVSPPKLTDDQRTRRTVNELPTVDEAGQYQNRYVNLDNINHQLFRSLDSSSQANTNQELFKTTNYDGRGKSQSQTSHNVFKPNGPQSSTMHSNHMPCTESNQINASQHSGGNKKAMFEDTVSQLQMKISALELKLNKSKEMTTQTQRTITQGEDRKNETQNSKCGAQISSHHTMEKTNTTTRQKEKPSISVEKNQGKTLGEVVQQLEMLSENSQESFNMNVLPLQGDLSKQGSDGQ